MNPSELLRSAFQALRAHKLRSFLTLLGVIIGVATIVAVVGIISGLDTYVKEKVIVLAPDVYILRKIGIPKSREEFLRQFRRPNITWQEDERLTSGVLSHTAQVAVGVGKSMVANAGARRLENPTVLGVTPNFGAMFNLDFEGGRFFSEAELAALGDALAGVQLREIDLSDNAVGPKGVEACRAFLANQLALERLLFCNCGISAEAADIVLLVDDLAAHG